MEITTVELETQIGVWAHEKSQAAAEIDMLNNQKNQAVGKLNYLEGAIQSYRVLISQIENGAVQDEAAPDDDNQEENDDGDTETP